jgi:hypothetical protein
MAVDLSSQKPKELSNTYIFQYGGSNILSKGKNQIEAYNVAQQFIESKGIAIPEWFKNHNYRVIDISTVYGIYHMCDISELSQYTLGMNFTPYKFNDYIIQNKNMKQSIYVKASSLQGAYYIINTVFYDKKIKVPEWLTEGSPNTLCVEFSSGISQFISYINVS